MRIALTILLILTAAGCFGAARPHPVALPVWDHGWIIVGGTCDGKWLPATRIAPMIQGGERYRLYSEDRPAGTAAGSKPRKSDLSQPCIKLAPFGEAEIAVSGDWTVLPRIPKLGDAKKKVYLDAVREVLVNRGLGKSAPVIDHVLEVDLEGDGHQEAIITARSSNYDLLGYLKGQYSFVMVRRTAHGKPLSLVLAGDFHTRNASRLRTGPLQPPYTKQYSTDGAWDIDGDGALEPMVTMLCQNLDASQTTLYDLANGRVRELGHASHAN